MSLDDSHIMIKSDRVKLTPDDVGKQFRTHRGEVITIINYDADNRESYYPYDADSGESYTRDGTVFNSMICANDLVERIEEPDEDSIIGDMGDQLFAEDALVAGGVPKEKLGKYVGPQRAAPKSVSSIEAEARQLQNVLRELPNNPTGRKTIPVMTGAVDYFPLAIAEVARVSVAGNEQHNPGQPLHWSRAKSSDHADCILRHLVERGTLDSDGQRHTAKVAWRALAMLQEELEAAAGWSPAQE